MILRALDRLEEWLIATLIAAATGLIFFAVLHRYGTGLSIDIAKWAEAQDAYNRSLDEALKDTVWNTGGCRSWYLDRRGRNSTIWPGPTWRYRRLMRRYDPAAYDLR